MTEYLVGHQQCLLNPDKLFLDHMLKFACSVAHNVSEQRMSALSCNDCFCLPFFSLFFTLNFDHWVVPPFREVTLPSSWWRQRAVLSSVSRPRRGRGRSVAVSCRRWVRYSRNKSTRFYYQVLSVSSSHCVDCWSSFLTLCFFDNSLEESLIYCRVAANTPLLTTWWLLLEMIWL